jgi:LPS-assembly lipoprotein
MSLSDRRTVLALLSAAPLAACGFTPVYAPGGVGTELRGRIRAAEPDTRLAFELVARLEDRLGRGDAAVYDLSYDIETTSSGLAITDADDITRVNIAGTLRYALASRETGAQVYSGELSTFTAYSTTGSPVATAAARRDAEDRLMIALADQLVSRLIASAPGWT